jgi:uroporphyrinogen-III synthase
VASLPAELTGRALIVAIGSTTAESLRERGLPAVEAAEPTITGVMDALERALRREG